MDAVALPSYPWRSQHHRKRKALIRQYVAGPLGDRFPVTRYVAAVVTLQRMWRGIVCRRRLLRVVQAPQRNWATFSQRSAAADRFGRVLDVLRVEAAAVDAAEERARALELEEALRMLQSRLRTAMLHKEVRAWWMRGRWPVYYLAAVTIQRAWQAASLRRRGASSYLLGPTRRMRHFYFTKADSAAARIQCAWRSRLQRLIFSFFAQTVREGVRSSAVASSGGSRSHAAAKLLQRANLGEGCMLEALPGMLHVRLRLAAPLQGDFPPVVVYKVCSSIPIADMGRFAPKDYVADAAAKDRLRRNVRLVHNKHSAASTAPPTSSSIHGAKSPAPVPNEPLAPRYKRTDGNTWRPLDPTVVEDRAGYAHAAALLKAASPKATISSGISTGATRARRSRAEQQAVVDTQRRWLAELYASEKVFEERMDRGGSSTNPHSPAATQQGTTHSNTHSSTFFANKQRAERLFRRVDRGAIADEVQRVRAWNPALDIESYRADWLTLGVNA